MPTTDDSKLKRLGLLHTSATLVPVFQKLLRERLPEVDAFHISDDSLIADVIRRGELTPHNSRRVADHIASAEAAGADYILVTCSSIGPAVEAAAPFIGVPVLRVDRPMAERAVASGDRIGVAATLPTTLRPTVDLITRCGAAAGRSPQVEAKICEGAFEALMQGDAQRHDDLVAEALKKLIAESDVVVLAQASMARVVEHLDRQDPSVPILASPPLAVEYLASVLILR